MYLKPKPGWFHNLSMCLGLDCQSLSGQSVRWIDRGSLKPAFRLNRRNSYIAGIHVNLTVRLGRLTLVNPVLVASGTFGYAQELAGSVTFHRLGGIIPKTITLTPRTGNPPPRTVETASGLLNAIGLDNDGLDIFLLRHLPYLLSLGTAIIPNIAGKSVEEFVELAARLALQPGIAALELNLSCPNVAGGIDFATDPAVTRRVVTAVRQVCRCPLIAKLTPNVTDLIPIAAAALEAGADALSLVNTFVGIAIDWRRRRPILASATGGLSGPAIKPLALRAVWQTYRALKAPIIGIGGIQSVDDAMEYLVAGASAIQVGTANFYQPHAAELIVDALPLALKELGVSSPLDAVGLAT